jgi:hypothetical protein
MSTKEKTKPTYDDPARFEAKLGKIARAKPKSKAT